MAAETSDGVPPRVAGVILAAGRSTRFEGERVKQLFEVDGEPLVRRAARTALASCLDEVVVVVGEDGDRVRAAVANLGVRTVRNPDFSEGQSTSVRVGLAAVPEDCGAAIFLPVDQPWLSAGTLDRLVAAWRWQDAAIVVPTHQGRRGAPVLFDRSLFGELAALCGDTGGRALFPRHAGRIASVDVADPRELADVDTLDDWRAWSGIMSAGSL